MAIVIEVPPKSSGSLVRSLVKLFMQRVAAPAVPVRADVRGLTRRGRPRPLEDC